MLNELTDWESKQHNRDALLLAGSMYMNDVYILHDYYMYYITRSYPLTISFTFPPSLPPPISITHIVQCTCTLYTPLFLFFSFLFWCRR